MFFPYQKIAFQIGVIKYDKLRELENLEGCSDLDSVEENI